MAKKIKPTLPIPIYLGSAGKIQGAALKQFITRIHPEEAQQVTDLWHSSASMKELLDFNRHPLVGTYALIR